MVRFRVEGLITEIEWWYAIRMVGYGCHARHWI
jgi:hypothetical protein